MSKAAPDPVMDAALDYVDLSDRMYLCSAQPANFAGIAAVLLATATMTPNTDYPKSDGTSGRKITVAAKSGLSVTASGSGTHVVLATNGDSTLRYVTTCPSVSVIAGGTVDIASWTIQIADPT